MIVDMFFKLEPNVASYTVPAELIRISDHLINQMTLNTKRWKYTLLQKTTNFYDADRF